MIELSSREFRLALSLPVRGHRPTVIDELQEINSLDEVHGHVASVGLDQAKTFTTRSVDLDAEFSLDDGDNAAITLVNDLDRLSPPSYADEVRRVVDMRYRSFRGRTPSPHSGLRTER